jgi:pimeloyl-ACP methyl ester carboxylesterase
VQAALAARSTNGRLVVVPNSGHLIAVEQPNAVAEAIEAVLGE